MRYWWLNQNKTYKSEAPKCREAPEKMKLTHSTTEIVILYFIVGVQLGALMVWWAQ
jgi:hypothetical protein